ncbi:MAG: rhodanese-like domain-containing protein [Thermoanaerobaculia bacterium]
MPEVTPSEAKQIIDADSQLIDIRTDVEYAAGHISGARHIPLADIQRESTHLDKDQPVVIYCRSGNRSGPAAEAFSASGWNARSIEGGLLAWAEAGFELEPEGGTVVDNPNMPPP